MDWFLYDKRLRHVKVKQDPDNQTKFNLLILTYWTIVCVLWTNPCY